ncbi:DUF2207 domain-containing protein [Georgenia subflava]|uniref:DUF2207 domain-containing protein n=1 Tax=Georgenia subflava TaxID=1622177 RepID=A0A6N7EKX5_9MICO|nr:DUF2207 domain-containing protein [Georgenia subflava]MPV37205.1 DUF2207 domain-containing protein [Georgenia subflava]
MPPPLSWETSVRAARTALRATAALLLTALVLLAPALAPPAHADGDPDDDVIRDLTIDVEITPDGVLHVSETYTWDFGDRDGLGLTRVLAQQFDWPADPDLMRVYEYSDIAVTSPSGAPAEVWTVADGADLELAIGAPDGSSDTRTGVQTYVLSYTVHGALNAIRGQDGVADQDELYWNVTGTDWRNPLQQVTTTVTGPVGIVDQACYQGPAGSTATCDNLEVDGATATYSSAGLAAYEGQTVMAAFPAGTFGEISPILEDDPRAAWRAEREAEERRERERRDAIARWTDPVADVVTASPPASFAVVAAAVGGLAWRRVRRGRDHHFVGVPPGVVPDDPTAARTAQLSDEPAETVRFSPPDDLRPAEVGALVDERITNEHISATIIDLAARGYLTIAEAGTNWRGQADDWTFTATPQAVPPSDPGPRPYERLLLQSLFGGRSRVRLQQLRNTFASDLARVKKQLGTELDARRLFVDPVRRRRRRIPVAIVAFVAMAVALRVGGSDVLRPGNVPGSAVLLAVVAVATLVAWVIMHQVTAKAARARTATGRALYEQARGFRLYVSTAEADQVRFEEGIDVFSRYLPYAMVFDEAERWSAIFAQLAAQGRQAAPRWYAGIHGPGHLDPSSFSRMGTAMSSFSSVSSSTLSSTPGSSGGSGSSGGGGGSSGGGGGGGGGGGR